MLGVSPTTQAAVLELAVALKKEAHAHTFWGLLTRTASTIAAHTPTRSCSPTHEPTQRA